LRCAREQPQEIGGDMKIDIVGGPAHGRQTERPRASTVLVPVAGCGRDEAFRYTIRRCRDAAGDVVEVLAPAGREIDPVWLKARKLTN
jgi:hypothetical protein